MTDNINTQLNPHNTIIQSSLDTLFPEQQYDEKNLKKAKEILGLISDDLSPEEILDTTVKIQYLCDAWLDAFECTIFDGETLKEFLHEKK